MITVTNKKIWAPGTGFKDAPGKSFSRLKNPDGIPVTPGVTLGSLVHKYVLEPQKYNGEQINVVKPAAMAIQKVLGNLKFNAEVKVTADFEHEGLTMPYKGIIDIDAGIIIDIKVSGADLVKSIQRFRYDWQMTGYCLSMGYDTALILGVNPYNFKTQLLKIPLVTDWWEYQIKQHGNKS